MERSNKDKTHNSKQNISNSSQRSSNRKSYNQTENFNENDRVNINEMFSYDRTTGMLVPNRPDSTKEESSECLDNTLLISTVIFSLILSMIIVYLNKTYNN